MREALGPDFFLLGEVIAGREGGRNGLPIAATYRALDCCYTDLSMPHFFDNAWELRKKAGTNKDFFPDDNICRATGTHDICRFASRLQGLPQAGGDRTAALRQEWMRLLCEPGDFIIYNGDELGLTQANVPQERRKDAANQVDNRDGERTPFVFHNNPEQPGAQNGGFSTSANPWLPVPPEHLPLAAAAQEHCQRSHLSFVRELIHWRRGQPALVKGKSFYLDNDGDIYGFVRASKEQTMLLLFNRCGGERSIELGHYLSDQLIQKLGLNETMITLTPYGTAAIDRRADSPEMHLQPLRPLLNVTAITQCNNCAGQCFRNHPVPIPAHSTLHAAPAA
jgi:hypothetical protein